MTVSASGMNVCGWFCSVLQRNSMKYCSLLVDGTAFRSRLVSGLLCLYQFFPSQGKMAGFLQSPKGRNREQGRNCPQGFDKPKVQRKHPKRGKLSAVAGGETAFVAVQRTKNAQVYVGPEEGYVQENGSLGGGGWHV